MQPCSRCDYEDSVTEPLEWGASGIASLAGQQDKLFNLDLEC